jgi:hypothetical protein
MTCKFTPPHPKNGFLDTGKEHRDLANGYVPFFFLYPKVIYISKTHSLSKISNFRATPTIYAIILGYSNQKKKKPKAICACGKEYRYIK